MELKEWIIGIAIFIMTLFVVIYGINTFYEKPRYENYCDIEKPVIQGDNSTQEKMQKCWKDYENARKEYSKWIFIISIPLSILIMIIGIFLFNLESVGAGLMAGSVGTLIYGIGGYWEYGENWFRFIVSLIGLIALIFIAYWFNKKFKNKK